MFKNVNFKNKTSFVLEFQLAFRFIPARCEMVNPHCTDGKVRHQC